MDSTHLRHVLLRVALPVLILILLYAGLGFLLVPRVIRSNAESFVSSHYHRTLSLGGINFNPFTLQLEIHDLALPDADGKPLLGVRHLLLNLGIASVWRLGPSFQAIELDQPYARAVIRSNGTLNLSDLALPPSPGAAPEPNRKPLRVFITRFSVRDGNVAFEDHAHPSPFSAEIKPIAFELRDFSTTGQTGGTYALNGVSERGERFGWSGSLRANPLASHGEFNVTDLQATTLSSFIRDSVRFDLPSGKISLKGDYDFDAATSPLGLLLNLQNITITDLGVRPKTDAAANYVSLRKVEILDVRADLAQRSVLVKQVHLSGGAVHAWLQAQGKLNLMQLMPAATSTATHAPAPTPTPAAPATPTTTAAAWSLSVPDIAVDAFSVSAEDRQVTPAVALELDRLSAHLSGFTTAGTAPLQLTLSSDVDRGGHLDVHGQISADLAAMQLETSLSKLDLTVLQPYIAARTAMALRSGVLSTRLKIDRDTNGLAASGEIDVAKLHTVDNALKQNFVSFERLQVSGIDYHSKPARLHVRAVVLRAPYARVIVESNRTVNVETILQPSGATPAAAPAAAPATASNAGAHQTAGKPATGDMAISLDSLRIRDGSAHYTDLWIQPHFSAAIVALQGSIQGVSSKPTDRAKVELNGKEDRYAPVHIWGEINPLAATRYTDIHMSVKGAELASITPYSGYFAGYKIDKGKASVEIAYKIENRKLTAEHHFVIDQLQLGERVQSPDATKLPLKIAIALLKDRNGVIDLNLPVTGSLDDPQFKLGPLIWKAMLGLFSKVASAPFAALGHLFGGEAGGEQLKYIDFRAGSAALEPAERGKLATLLTALKEKSQLQLEVPASFVPDADRPALAKAHLQKRLLSLAGAPASASTAHDGSTANTATSSAPAAAESAAATEPALTNPVRRYHLLVQLYHAELGKDAALPEAAQAFAAASKQKGATPDATGADTELESALLPKFPVADDELSALGRHRARAIQDALLSGGQLDPSRVFVTTGESKPAAEAGGVRVELALK